MPEDLLANPDIRKTVTQIEESAFSPSQLYSYEQFWDLISVEKTPFNSGKREGIAEGKAKGLKEGRAEGEHNKQIEIARKMKTFGLTLPDIAKMTGLTEQDIAGFKRQMTVFYFIIATKEVFHFRLCHTADIRILYSNVVSADFAFKSNTSQAPTPGDS